MFNVVQEHGDLCDCDTNVMAADISTNHFINEINTSNPLGSQGLIALAYAKVIKEMWQGENPIVMPLNFKCILSKFKK